MSFSKVKAVTFDAAHTLFQPKPSVGAIYREVMSAHDLDYAEDALEQGFRHAFKTVRKDTAILDGERREWSYWNAIVRDSIAALSPQPSDFDALFADLWETFADGRRWSLESTAVETLQTLRSRGFQTVLLTNWDQRVYSVLADHKLTPLFDTIVVSSEVGHEKPDLPIFRHTEQALRRAPEEILHVGDSLQHDIAGATAAGWNAVRITNELPTPTKDLPQIQSLNQLLDLL